VLRSISQSQRQTQRLTSGRVCCGWTVCGFSESSRDRIATSVARSCFVSTLAIVRQPDRSANLLGPADAHPCAFGANLLLLLCSLIPMRVDVCTSYYASACQAGVRDEVFCKTIKQSQLKRGSCKLLMKRARRSTWASITLVSTPKPDSCVPKSDLGLGNIYATDRTRTAAKSVCQGSNPVNVP